jgi:hypothetical protein
VRSNRHRDTIALMKFGRRCWTTFRPILGLLAWTGTAHPNRPPSLTSEGARHRSVGAEGREGDAGLSDLQGSFDQSPRDAGAVLREGRNGPRRLRAWCNELRSQNRPPMGKRRRTFRTFPAQNENALHQFFCVEMTLTSGDDFVIDDPAPDTLLGAVQHFYEMDQSRVSPREVVELQRRKQRPL